MQIGVLGINHKLADLKLRERLAKACQRYFDSSNTTHTGHFFILLSTCNRTEIYFSSQNLADSHSYLLQFLKHIVDADFDQKLYSYFGIDCFTHLCTVASGLDSAIIAETEIQGQVKAAYAKASCYPLPRELHYLFQKALKVSKSVRSSLPDERGIPDIEDAIYLGGKELFQVPEKCSLLFVGASAINIKILNTLKRKQINKITICNRTDDKSAALAKKLDIEILPWRMLGRWHRYDWIIFGTKAQEPLILREHLPHSAGKKLIVDLCVPRNVDPNLGKEPGITLWNIDKVINSLRDRQKQLKHAIIEADSRLEAEALRQVALFHQKERVRLQLLPIHEGCLTA